MVLSIHETKEQILANAYHLYPSHKYHNIILGTNGPLLPVRQYHAYIVANVCADVHCNVSQHCSTTSSILITGLNSDTIGGAYTNLLDAMMYRCWKSHGQPHGDVQHIPGHGLQESIGPSATSDSFGSGTAAASSGGNLGSAQRTASPDGRLGSCQGSTGSALFGQRPQSTVYPLATTNLSQGGHGNGAQTKGVRSSVTHSSGIHNHNGSQAFSTPDISAILARIKPQQQQQQPSVTQAPSPMPTQAPGQMSENNHCPSRYSDSFGNSSHAVGEAKWHHSIKGCETVDCKVCLYLNDSLAQGAQIDDTHGPRVRGQGVSGHGPRSSSGFTFGTAARKSMDNLKGSTDITFGTATKSIDNHKISTGITFDTTAKRSADSFKTSPRFEFRTPEKFTDAPKNSTGIMFGTGVKISTQDRSVAGQATTGGPRFRFNDVSNEYPDPPFQNIWTSNGSRYPHNNVLNKQDASGWRLGRRFE